MVNDLVSYKPLKNKDLERLAKKEKLDTLTYWFKSIESGSERNY